MPSVVAERGVCGDPNGRYVLTVSLNGLPIESHRDGCLRCLASEVEIAWTESVYERGGKMLDSDALSLSVEVKPGVVKEWKIEGLE